jgi:hypothetical protein
LQNFLACCTFDLRFQYVLSGWDGSAPDAAVYDDACQTDLTVLAGKFYLADAGFGACDALLIPHCCVHYHLAEWGRADARWACFVSYNTCQIRLIMMWIGPSTKKSSNTFDMLQHGMSLNGYLLYLKSALWSWHILQSITWSFKHEYPLHSVLCTILSVFMMRMKYMNLYPNYMIRILETSMENRQQSQQYMWRKKEQT